MFETFWFVAVIELSLQLERQVRDTVEVKETERMEYTEKEACDVRKYEKAEI